MHRNNILWRDWAWLYPEHRHFITANLQEFDLAKDKDQCSSSFLELADGVHDTDHLRRLPCHSRAGSSWATASNKLFIEYLFDIEDTRVRLGKTLISLNPVA